MRQSGWAIAGIVLAAMLSIAGTAVSALLLQHHLAVEVGGNPLLSGVCDMSERTSCDEVLSSEWGSVRGIPTAMLGVFYFAAMASWFIVVGRPIGTRRRLQIIPLLATAAGAGIAAGLAYLMYTRLNKVCPLCAATHVIAGLLFVLSLLLWQKRPSPVTATTGTPDSPLPAIAPTHPSVRLLLVTVLLAVVTSGFAWSEYHRRIEKANARQYLAKWQYYEADHYEVLRKMMTQPQVRIPISPDDPALGPANAPHTVVMFTDFQCPYCPRLARLLHEKLELYPQQFRLVFKHFPMNKDCNSHVMGKAHVAACYAAVTAEAARRLGGHDAFWKMHDELFNRQASFLRKNQEFMREACAKVGLDLEAVLGEIQSTDANWQRIRRNADEGHAVGVQATPTVFYDGRRVDGWINSKFWDLLLRPPEQRTGRSASQPATRSVTRPG